jgi:ubiquinone/menaquinone biosynthesis C-methylase UbiE
MIRRKAVVFRFQKEGYRDYGQTSTDGAGSVFADRRPLRYDEYDSDLNLDKYWRRRALELAAPRPGEKWLDVCCGTGKLTLAIRRILGHEGEVVGLDFTPSMLAVAGGRSSWRSSSNPFVAGSGCHEYPICG